MNARPHAQTHAQNHAQNRAKLDAPARSDSHPMMLRTQTLNFATLILVMSVLMILIMPLLAGCDGGTLPATVPVTVAGKTFNCKLAITNATREKGLGGVASLGADEGMIFAFTDSQQHRFWMRGCLMGLDIAFIDPLGFVTAVHTMPNDPPQAAGETEDQYLGRLVRYPSLAPAQFALEVAPGALAPLGVKRGMRIEFDRDLLKKLAE